MTPNSVSAVLCVLLLVSVASAAHLRRDTTNHDSTKALTKAFVSTQGDTADAGADAKAADLTDSIQGLFDDTPDAPVAKQTAPAKTQPVAPPPAPTAPKKSPPAVVKALEKKTEVVQAKHVAKVAKVDAEAVQAKHVAKVAKVNAEVVQTKQGAKDVNSKSSAVKAKQVPTVVKGKAKVVQAKHVAKVEKVNAKVVRATQKAFLKAATTASLKAAPAVKPAAKTSELKVRKIAGTESQAKPATMAKKVLHAKPVASAQKAVQMKGPVMTAKKAEAKIPVKDTKVSKAPQAKAPQSKGTIIAKVQVAEKGGQSSAGVPVTMIHQVATVVAKAVGVKTVAAKTVAAKKVAAKKVAAKTVMAKKVAAKIVATKVAVAAKTVASKVEAAKTANAQEVGTKVVVAKIVAAKTVVAKTVAATTAAGKTVVAKTVAKGVFGPWSLKHEPAQAKKSKAIEEAVVSLPMASFALGDTKAATVTTPPPKKFPGNATQKAAWEKHEQALERELATLKDRLANTSKTVEANKAAVPKATGTFSVSLPDAPDSKAHESEAGDKNDKPSAKFMASKVPAPTQPILSDDKPKAVAAPVPVKAVAAVPPQKEEDEDEVDMEAMKAISQSYQHKPAMVESALALEAIVVHGTKATDDESSAIESKIKAATVIEDTDSAVSAASSPSSLWGWFSSFFSWGSGSPSPTVAATKQVAPVASLMDVTETHWDDAGKRKRWEDAQVTAQATKDEAQHIIQVNDAWSHMEQEDVAEEEQVRSQDQAERERAETAALPHTLSKADVQGRHGVHGADMSSFWGSLEKEDSGIEHSIDKDDMGEYVRLTKQQAVEVVEASKHVRSSPQIAGNSHTLKHNDDARIAIHEPWARREKRDIALEQKVHDSPDLQMLQLQHQHKRK